MTVTQKTVLKIVCDNPNCPGNDLDPTSYDGWYRVNVATQIPQPTMAPLPGGVQTVPMSFPTMSPEKVFCSPGCVATIEQTLVEEEEAREAAANPPELENDLPEAEAKTTRSRAKK